MTYKFVFHGQIRGGKNHIQISRAGQRYPTKAWKQWCVSMVESINIQRMQFGIRQPITDPCALHIEYTSEDNRRRDSTALLDAIYHVLERTGVVADDAQFKWVNWIDYGKEAECLTKVYLMPLVLTGMLPARIKS